MFQISDQRVEIPIHKLKDEVPTTLLCGGIVNPLGPSLSAMVLLGEAKPGHTLQLVEVMLNPFAQEAHRIGSATIPQGGRWCPIDDYAPLLEVPCLRGCPTLLLRSLWLKNSNAIEIHARWLCRFPDARQRWKMIQKHRSDPWTRIDEEMKAGWRELDSEKIEGETEGPLTKSDALEFAKFALSDEHTVPEVQAFAYAWKGSIDFQSESGNGRMASEALQLADFWRWLALLAYSCHFPAKPKN